MCFDALCFTCEHLFVRIYPSVYLHVRMFAWWGVYIWIYLRRWTCVFVTFSSDVSMSLNTRGFNIFEYYSYMCVNVKMVKKIEILIYNDISSLWILSCEDPWKSIWRWRYWLYIDIDMDLDWYWDWMTRDQYSNIFSISLIAKTSMIISMYKCLCKYSCQIYSY